MTTRARDGQPAVDGGDVQAVLVEALRTVPFFAQASMQPHLIGGQTVAALAPVVARLCEQFAAEALREAADDWWRPGRPHRPVRDWLLARADDLARPRRRTMSEQADRERAEKVLSQRWVGSGVDEIAAALAAAREEGRREGELCEQRAAEALREAADDHDIVVELESEHWQDGRYSCPALSVTPDSGRLREGIADELAGDHLHWCQSEAHGDCCNGECDCGREERRLAIVDTFRRILAERDDNTAAVQRVRALHQQQDGPYGQVCASCIGSDEENLNWPCPTIRALDSGA